MHDELKNAENKVVGLKQLLRELEADTVACVYIAGDAEEHVREKITEAIGAKEIHVVFVDTMEELGGVCGIDVSAACAAILKQ